MKKFIFKISILCICFLAHTVGFGQSPITTVEVCITNFATLNDVDCDGFGAGDSDYEVSFGGNDYEESGNNGPFSVGVNLCETIETCSDGIINFTWEAYEDDGIGGSDGDTGPQTIMIDPANPPVGTVTVGASSTDGGCDQDYEIVYQVTMVTTIPQMADNICDAIELTPGGGFIDYAWCDDYTREPCEDIIHDNENADKTAWFYFVAPSRDVEISTNGGNTTIGTEFALYHSANGSDCQGFNICDLTLIKEKCEYLSDHDFADDDIPVIDPNGEAAQDWDCGILGMGPGLIPGETYYVQMGSDQAETGIISIVVNDDVGGTAVQPDVPCTAFDADPFIDTTENADGVTSEEFDILTDCAYDDEFSVDDPSSVPNHPNDPTNGTLNSSTVWISFTAPNSGRIYAEFNCPLQGEQAALYMLDPAFGPGCPTEYSCANLIGVQDDPIQGNGYSDSGALGGGTAIIEYNCLEPGYTYFIVADEPDAAFCDIDTWIYDPSVVDAGNNNPLNDVMCLALADAQFEVPVNVPGSCGAENNPGDNTRACEEMLAGEPAIGIRQTTWHYFTVPPSGTVEINVIAGSIGVANFAVYPTADDTAAGCYGGLGCNAYADPGGCTLTPCASGTSDTAVTKCCLTPGDVLAIQIDGATGTGTYDIEINEIDPDAGAVTYVDPDGDSVTSGTAAPSTAGPAIFCSTQTLVPTTNAVECPGADYCGEEAACNYPACLTPGYLLHDTPSPTNIAAVTTIYGTDAPGGVAGFVNDGTYPTCEVIYISPVVDGNTTDDPFGEFCPSAAIGDAAPVVFLTPLSIVAGATVDGACSVSFAVEGGLQCFDPAAEYSFELFDSTGATSEGVTGTTASGVGTLITPDALNYIIRVTDGEGCPIDIPVDATACTPAPDCEISNGTWSKG